MASHRRLPAVAIMDVLRRELYETRIVPLDAGVLDVVESWLPDLVIFDWIGSQEEAALGLCAQVRRESGVPMLVIASSTDDGSVDIVAALNAGVDGVLPDLVGPNELLARVRAVLRRRSGAPRQAPPAAVTLDALARTLQLGGAQFLLSETECLIMSVLLQAQGRVVPKAQLISAVWGAPSRRYRKPLDAHVRRLREKIELDPSSPALLRTVRGVGFLFERVDATISVADGVIELEAGSSGEVIDLIERVEASGLDGLAEAL